MARRGRGRPPHPDVLTPAEWQGLDWLRHGVNRHQIARLRRPSLHAVKFHIANTTPTLGDQTSRQLRQWPGFPAKSPIPRRKEPQMPATDLRLGPIGQVSMQIRDVARAERFYGETLGLPHVFTFGDLAF